ncbi:MAG: carboxymuconolactone decarboxylase family protein [Alphaproteobacteria bacterium]
MQERLNYGAIAPDGYRAFGKVHQYLATCGLESMLIHLVYLRVSQINGCAFCVDKHYRDALAEGEDPRKLNSVVVWAESPFFSARERAAFAWAESLTHVSTTHAADADYAAAQAQFNDKELVDLTYAVSLMNAFNRLGVGFRRQPSLHPASKRAAE